MAAMFLNCSSREIQLHPVTPCFCGVGGAWVETRRGGQKTCTITWGYGACLGGGGGMGRVLSFFWAGGAVSACENLGMFGETAWTLISSALLKN